MKILLVLSIIFSINTFARSSQADFQNGFVEIRKGKKLYVEYKVATKKQPTLFLLNGLLSQTTDWHPMVSELLKINPDLGIVLYDMEGMGQTLIAKAPIAFNIPYEEQVRDLHDLKVKLNPKGSVSVAGLSYGGGVALASAARYPNDFEQVIVMAPYLAPVREADEFIKNLVTQHRFLYPLDPRDANELYDFYLHNYIFTNFPLAEPGSLRNPYLLEAIYRLIQGAKNFRAFDIRGELGDNRLHIIGAKNDEIVKDKDLHNFWQQLPKESCASYLRLLRTSHKIPYEQPEVIAQWLQRILTKDSELFVGKLFELDP